MHTSKHRLYMGLLSALIAAIIITTYVAGYAPVAALQSEATRIVAIPTESVVPEPTPGKLVDEVLREAINDLLVEQTGSNLLVLKKGLPPVGSKTLTTEINGLKEVTATVLAINELDRKQSSVSFNVLGQSATAGVGLKGEIQWDGAGSFVLDAPLALGLAKVTVPTETGAPLIIAWQRATVLGERPGQSGEELKNAILKLYPPPGATWKNYRIEGDAGAVPIFCKYPFPFHVPGLGPCPFGDKALTISKPSLQIDDVLWKAINDLPVGQAGSNLLVLKEGLPPVRGQLLITEINRLKEVTATVLAINELNKKRSSVSFSVPGQLTTADSGLKGEIQWDGAGSFAFDAPLVLGLPKVTVPIGAGTPLIIAWQRATVLGAESGQSDEELKNTVLKLYPPLGMTWKNYRPQGDEGAVPIFCKYPILIPGVGIWCPIGEEAPK